MQPVAVIRVVAQRREVIDCNTAAQTQGVRVGHTEAEARSLCPGIELLDHTPDADVRALDALGRWLTRFTPVVCRGWEGDDPSLEPAALFLDLTGSDRLFGGLASLVDLIQRALSGGKLSALTSPFPVTTTASNIVMLRARLAQTCLHLPAQFAVAPTPGAAWALAVTNGRTPKIVDPATLRDALLPLPVATLRVANAIVTNLQHLGLRTIGDVLALDRAQLPARFGSTLLKRIDQLTGDLPEPLVGLVYETPITARMEFDSPVDAQEHLGLIYEKLLSQILPDLVRRNRGARQLRLTLTPDRGWGLPTITRVIDLSRPHRHRPTLLNLLRNEIERIDCEHGFVRFQLDIPRHEAVADEQVQLFDQKQAENERELDRLIERLRSKLGAEAVTQPRLVESYLPERAWAQDGKIGRPVASELTPRRVKAAKKLKLGSREDPSNVSSSSSVSPSIISFSIASSSSQASSMKIATDPSIVCSIPLRLVPAEQSTAKPDIGFYQAASLEPSRDLVAMLPPRPLTLFPTPIEIRVICEPSDDRTGRPRQFTWQGIVHRLTHVVGPERIAGEWWRGHLHTRDYYDAQDTEGGRFWMFRVLHVRAADDIAARWFVHGGF